MVNSVYEVTSAGKPDAPAIGAPGRPWLSYAGLKKLTDDTLAALNGVGIGRGDRVAMVVPNGPEMASSFIAVASGTTSAPLNPAYRADEFEFYLDDLKPKAVIVQQGMDSPVRAVAVKVGVPIVELVPTADAPAGTFTLDVSALKPAKAAKPGTSVGEEIALVLHTSGTTARPKIVPLSTANLAASARHIGKSLTLTPVDRCLNIMPLFHIHGLIAATLSSLGAGASVSCTPGFNALRFFAWLEEVKPTWYTAVPTMHQAILGRLRSHVDAAKAAKLRFIRSSSASLPPQVMAELEAAFDCPVIEAYGMTEASHQMASNALPPGKRKPGAVGLAEHQVAVGDLTRADRDAAFAAHALPAQICHGHTAFEQSLQQNLNKLMADMQKTLQESSDGSMSASASSVAIDAAARDEPTLPSDSTMARANISSRGCSGSAFIASVCCSTASN